MSETINKSYTKGMSATIGGEVLTEEMAESIREYNRNKNNSREVEEETKLYSGHPIPSHENFTKYYRIPSGIIFKITGEPYLGYRFDKKNMIWTLDPTFLVDFDYGNIRAEEIIITNDNYPMEKLEDLQGRRL